MNFEVTATRKRPQTFADLVGQEFIVSTLSNSLINKRIANAYLFAGPRGIGKTSAARILAKALNCSQGPTPQPCGTCNACREISQGNSLDVIEIDGASHTSVNDVRIIRDEVLFSPTSHRYKIYIIDEVHMLSNSAFNALLKTIEEPPPYIVFIFATTEIHKVPATIRSRCQQYNFRLLSIEDIISCLEKVVTEMQIKADRESLLWIAREATGSLRDAYTLFDQIVSFSEGEIKISKIQEKLGLVGVAEISNLVNALAQGEVQSALELVNSILLKGVAEEQVLISLLEYFRNILLIKNGITKEAILGFAKESFAEEILSAFTIPQTEKALEIILEALRSFRFSLNQRFELELLIHRLSKMHTLITQQEILNQLQAIKNELFQRSPFTSQPKTEAIKASDTGTTLSADELLKKIAEAVGRKKITLASALKKILHKELKNNELILVFKEADRFSADLIAKERVELVSHASQLLGQPINIRINIEAAPLDVEMVDEGEHLIKSIFKGNLVKGE